MSRAASAAESGGIFWRWHTEAIDRGDAERFRGYAVQEWREAGALYRNALELDDEREAIVAYERAPVRALRTAT